MVIKWLEPRLTEWEGKAGEKLELGKDEETFDKNFNKYSNFVSIHSSTCNLHKEQLQL